MKNISRLVLVTMLLAVTSGIASAAFTGPYVDTWVVVGGANNPSGKTLWVQDSLNTCNDSQIIYIQFDASQIQTVTGASLTLTATPDPIGVDTTPKLSLYGVADFDPATLTGSNAPTTAGLTPIQTLSVPPTTNNGALFTFGGAHDGLRAYVQSQAMESRMVDFRQGVEQRRQSFLVPTRHRRT